MDFFNELLLILPFYSIKSDSSTTLLIEYCIEIILIFSDPPQIGVS